MKLHRGIAHAECWIALALFMLQLAWGATFALVTPPFDGPDEPLHYGYLTSIVQHRSLPAPSELPIRHPPLYYALSALLVRDLPRDALGSSQIPTNPFAVYDGSTPIHDNRNINAFTHSDLQTVDAVALRRVRLFSALLGAATIVLVFFSARLIFRGDNLLAAAAAILASALPPFAWITSVVNNDSLAILMGAALTYAGLREVTSKTSGRSALALGVLAGLGMMTKFNLWIFMPVLLALIFFGSLGRSLGRAVINGLLFVASTLAVSAWWFVRNGLLKPEIAGLAQLKWLGPVRWRHTPSTGTLLRCAFDQIAGVWNRYGYQVELPGWATWLGIGLVLVAVAGLLVRLREGRVDWHRPVFWAAVIAAANLASGLYAVWISRDGGQGRLLYPAGTTTFAVLLVSGWSRLCPKRLSRWCTTCAVGVLACLSLLAFACVYRVAYAPPRLYPAGELPPGVKAFNADFGMVALVGADVEPRRVKPGDSVTVTACWSPSSMRQDMEVTEQVDILDPSGNLVANRFTLPGLGRYRSADWIPGQVFCDAISVRIPPQTATQSEYQVVVKLPGLHATQAGKRVASLIVGKIAVPSSISTLPPGATPVEARVGGAALLGYALTEASSSSSMQVSLYWRAEASLPESYHVFVHVLDAKGNLVAQSDGVPGSGRYPTDVWGRREIVEDRHQLGADAAAIESATQLLVGMYEYPSLQRLPVEAPEVRDSAIVLPLPSHVAPLAAVPSSAGQ